MADYPTLDEMIEWCEKERAKVNHASYLMLCAIIEELYRLKDLEK